MPNSCICCGRVKGKGDKVSMFRLLADKTRRQQWLDALNLTEDDVNELTHICSRHFLHGDPCNTPALDLGKRFASPKKMNMDQSRRALKRAGRSLSTTSLTVTPSSSRASSVSAPTPGSTTDEEPMSVAIGEPLLSVHELPSQGDNEESGTALAARVEYLEAETKHLRSRIDAKKAPLLFRIE